MPACSAHPRLTTPHTSPTHHTHAHTHAHPPHAAPEHLSSFYLTAYLDSLKEQGYTIFVVRGPLPASPGAEGGGGDMDGPGKWFSPDEVGVWGA